MEPITAIYYEKLMGTACGILLMEIYGFQIKIVMCFPAMYELDMSGLLCLLGCYYCFRTFLLTTKIVYNFLKGKKKKER